MRAVEESLDVVQSDPADVDADVFDHWLKGMTVERCIALRVECAERQVRHYRQHCMNRRAGVVAADLAAAAAAEGVGPAALIARAVESDGDKEGEKEEEEPPGGEEDSGQPLQQQQQQQQQQQHDVHDDPGRHKEGGEEGQFAASTALQMHAHAAATAGGGSGDLGGAGLEGGASAAVAAGTDRRAREGDGVADDAPVLDAQMIELLREDTFDQYRLFEFLERYLRQPKLFLQQSLCPLNPLLQLWMINRYYMLDDAVVRDLAGKKLSPKVRRDMDDVSDSSGIPLRSCLRQFDNVKRVFAYLDDSRHFQGSLFQAVHSRFFLPDWLAVRYVLVVTLSLNRFQLAQLKRRVNALSAADVEFFAAVLLSCWVPSDDDFERLNGGEAGGLVGQRAGRPNTAMEAVGPFLHEQSSGTVGSIQPRVSSMSGLPRDSSLLLMNPPPQRLPSGAAGPTTAVTQPPVPPNTMTTTTTTTASSAGAEAEGSSSSSSSALSAPIGLVQMGRSVSAPINDDASTAVADPATIEDTGHKEPNHPTTTASTINEAASSRSGTRAASNTTDVGALSDVDAAARQTSDPTETISRSSMASSMPGDTPAGTPAMQSQGRTPSETAPDAHTPDLVLPPPSLGPDPTNGNADEGNAASSLLRGDSAVAAALADTPPKATMARAYSGPAASSSPPASAVASAAAAATAGEGAARSHRNMSLGQHTSEATPVRNNHNSSNISAGHITAGGGEDEAGTLSGAQFGTPVQELPGSALFSALQHAPPKRAAALVHGASPTKRLFDRLKDIRSSLSADRSATATLIAECNALLHPDASAVNAAGSGGTNGPQAPVGSVEFRLSHQAFHAWHNIAKSTTKVLLSMGSNLTQLREYRDVFEDLVIRVGVPLKMARLSRGNVRAIFHALVLALPRLRTRRAQPRFSATLVLAWRRYLLGCWLSLDHVYDRIR